MENKVNICNLMDMCTDTCRHTQTVLHLIIREYLKHLSSHNHKNLFSTIKKTKFCCNDYCIFLTLKKRTLNHLFLWNKMKIFALSTEMGVQFTCSVVSNSLQHCEPQHTRPPCPSPTPGAYPNSCPLSQ